jgi:hypothetical protein
MSTHDVMTKAFEERIDAQLQQVKAQLAEFEARAKGRIAQSEIDTLNHLRTKHHEIERRRQDLKTIAGARVEQHKSEIDADIAKLKSSLAELDSKLRTATPR